MTVQEIKELIGVFSASEAVEMELKQSDIELALRKASSVSLERQITEAPQNVTAQVTTSVQEPIKDVSEPAAAEPVTAEEQNLTEVTAPLAGIFYRASSPDAAPYVCQGQQVKKGETIGLIEAMKIINEIPAPCDGVVDEILAENGAFVSFETALMRIS